MYRNNRERHVARVQARRDKMARITKAIGDEKSIAGGEKINDKRCMAAHRYLTAGENLAAKEHPPPGASRNVIIWAAAKDEAAAGGRK